MVTKRIPIHLTECTYLLFRPTYEIGTLLADSTVCFAAPKKAHGGLLTNTASPVPDYAEHSHYVKALEHNKARILAQKADPPKDAK